MPAQNGTGPQGNGPMTGRGTVRCRVGTGNNENTVPAAGRRGQGQGSGRNKQKCRRGKGGSRGNGMNRGGFGPR